MPSTSQVSEGGDSEEFVRIINPANNETIGVLLSKDGTLPIIKLDRYFPGSKCLQYKNEEIDLKCFVDFDSERNVFLAPSGGWDGKLFTVVYKDERERTASPIDVNMSPASSNNELHARERTSSPYATVPVSPPNGKDLIIYCFYINENGNKSCVTPIDNSHFITFRHGTHSQFKIGDEFQIHSDDGSQTFNSVIEFICENLDFIIIKSNQKIMEKNTPISRLKCSGQRVTLAGRGNRSSELSFINGIVHKGEEYFFGGLNHLGSDTICGPFTLCTNNIKPGDSGSSVWDGDCLVGIIMGFENFSSQPKEDVNERIANAARFDIRNYIVMANTLLKALAEFKQPTPVFFQ